MQPISHQYLRSRCEVRTLDDKWLTAGILSDSAEKEIRIGKGSEFLPTLHCGTLVKVVIKHDSLEMLELIGKVYLSSPEILQITNIQSQGDFERRNFFRLKLNLHTQAFSSQNDGTPIQPVELFQIYVSDLSLSGFFIKTRKVLEIGDYINATLPLSDVRVSFICKVQRFQKANSRSNGYGCSFENNTNRQFDLLCKYIFEKQREQIRSSRKDLY
jgi:c-di-GMP-binding flagellar brake protein YcgR